MQTITVSHGVEAAPHDHLRLRIAALDGLHDAPALLGGAGVHGDVCGHCSVGWVEFPLHDALLDTPAPNPELRQAALRYRSPLSGRQSMALSLANTVLYLDIT